MEILDAMVEILYMVLLMFKKNGLTTETNYPFKAENQACNSSEAAKKVATIK